METQFNISIAAEPANGKVILTTDTAGLLALSENTTREYSRYFTEAHERLQRAIIGKVLEDPAQPPLPGL